jgi:hypothetical protein
MVGRYKPARLEAVHHDPPAKILEDIVRIESQIVERAQQLNKILA